MSNKTLINGTGYELKGGKTLVNGTGYSVKQGKTLVNGAGYTVGFGTPVSSLAIGQTVFMDVRGTRSKFLIVHQGNPDPNEYDASCEGTWLLIKDSNFVHSWNTSATSIYAESSVHNWLNTDVLDGINVKNLIKSVKIPYHDGNGLTGTHKNLSNGLQCKLFLLSLMECGYPGKNQISTEGSKLDYFELGIEGPACSKRQMYVSAFQTAMSYYLRSVNTAVNDRVYRVNEGGSFDYGYPTPNYCTRFCLILPFNVKIDENFNIIP